MGTQHTETSAAAIHRALIQTRDETEAAFIRMGGYLREVRDERLYTFASLGNHDTFEAYLADPDVGIRKRWAYRLIRLAEDYQGVYVSPNDLVKIGVAKAEIIAPLLRGASREAQAGWVAKAKVLGVRDLARDVRESQGETYDDSREIMERLSFRIRGQAAKLPYDPNPSAILREIMGICTEALAEPLAVVA